MESGASPARRGDLAVAVLATWAALTLAGGIGILIHAMPLKAWFTSAAFALLLAAYSAGTARGRRSPIAHFWIGLLMLVPIGLLLLFVYEWSGGAIWALALVGAWSHVGYFSSGADSPLEFSGGLWLASLLLLAWLAVGVRNVVRFHRDDRGA